MTTTVNPLTTHLFTDEENQNVIQSLTKKDNFPLYPASTWMKHQFKRAMSKEERSLLLSRVFKYLILARTFINPEVPGLMISGTYAANPPEINGFPISCSFFFQIFVICKAISLVILFICLYMFLRAQKQAGIDRILSLEMLDHMKFSNIWTIIAGITTFLNMGMDAYVLYYLRCNASECSHVTSSNPDGSSVLQFQYYLIINFVLTVICPFIYWTQLVLPCCANPPPCCNTQGKEDEKRNPDGAVFKDINIHS